MSVNTTFPFTASADYTFDAAKVEFVGSKAKLKLVNDTGKTFTQDFASSSGYTFDAAKTEFSGGVVRQKTQRPTDATFGATYTSAIDGSWGDGVLTGTAVNGCTVSGGKLVCDGTVSAKYVSYTAAGNVSALTQTGCIRFMLTPLFTTSPAQDIGYLSVSLSASNTTNLLQFTQANGSGFASLVIRSSSDTPIVSSLHSLALVSGVECEIEINFDLTAGATRVFKNGVQVGSTDTNTGTRTGTSALFRIGSSYDGRRSNFQIDNFEVFSTVQHTANYTPGYTLHDTDYVTDTVTCPTHTYSGPGSVQAWTAFAGTDTNTPRYVVNGQYWTGSAWAASSDTWATASTKADVIANIATLAAANTLIVKIVWNAGASQMSVDTYTATYTGQIYPTDNPTVVPTTVIRNEGLVGFVETVTKSGSDDVRYTLSKDGTYYYWNGTTWATSSGYAQSNTAAEILANITTFTTTAVDTYPKVFLHSASGATTPEIDTLSVDFDYRGTAADSISKCIVYGNTKDLTGTASTDPFTITLNKNTVKYKTNTILRNKTVEVTPRSDGYFEVELVETENMADTEARYCILIDRNYYTIQVPNVTTKNIIDLIE